MTNHGRMVEEWCRLACEPKSTVLSLNLSDRNLAIHQHGKQPVAEFRELLVLFLIYRDLVENGASNLVECQYRFPSRYDCWRELKVIRHNRFEN